MSEHIRILIVDDHPLIREGLRAVLETQPDLELVGEACDGYEAVRQALALKPDIIMMDLALPRKDGIAAIREILRAAPSIKVLVLSNYLEDEKVFGALRAGAKGYILKETGSQEVRQAVRNIYQGKAALDPAVQRKLVDHVAGSGGNAPVAGDELTERELEVLRLMARGSTNSQIAALLSVAEGTVRFHVSNILRKLGMENRTQAVLYALQRGLASRE
jgi:NarL family two-component system response regulator LiaR